MEDLMSVLGLGASFATGGVGALAGAVVRLLPAAGTAVMSYFREKADRAHEYKMRELDRQIAKDGSEQRIREADVAGHWEAEGRLLDAYKTALEGQAKPSGIAWVDALNSFVRPGAAYYFLALYGLGKGLKVVYAWSEKASLKVMSELIWTPTDEAMLGAILGFYFVDRQLGKQKAAFGWTSSR